jgi:hypothetical protein
MPILPHAILLDHPPVVTTSIETGAESILNKDECIAKWSIRLCRAANHEAGSGPRPDAGFLWRDRRPGELVAKWPDRAT